MVNNVTTHEVLTLANPSFCTYLIVASLLILKMMGLTLLTIMHRFKNKVFISEEDAAWSGGEVSLNSDVERVRRAFQNDLEGIPTFLIVSLCYLWTQSPEWVVHILLYGFLLTRTLHSIVYAVYVIRQPTRAILWGIGFIITGYMSIHVALYAFIVGYLGK